MTWRPTEAELVELMEPDELAGYLAIGRAIRQTLDAGATYIAVPLWAARLAPAYPLVDLDDPRLCAQLDAGRRHLWCALDAGHDGRHGYEAARVALADADAAGYDAELDYLDELDAEVLAVPRGT